jgi:hypothetical protein
MNAGRTVFSQLMEFVVIDDFRACVRRYNGHYKVQGFSCWDQYLAMSFAQLTFREGLRDIEACLRSQEKKLYHMGFRSRICRSTLADANESRDWRIYADYAQRLIHEARLLYVDDDFGVDLDNTVYALDSTTIDLCLSVFPWAHFRRHKGAVKMHTLLDLKGPIPSFIRITSGKVHDVNILDDITPEPGAFYVMDRAYLDFARLYRLHQSLAFFVIRPKSNFNYRRVYSHAFDDTTGVRCDQTISLTGFYPKLDYPEHLRRIKYIDLKTERRLAFLTNNFVLPAHVVAQLYKCRWDVELFFKWIKQHLRIKKFYGTSENAVKTQIWIAVSIYVLVAIVKKRLNLNASLYTILQIVSVNLFEKTPLHQLLMNTDNQNDILLNHNQLELFNL